MSRGDARWLSRTRVIDLAGSCSRQLTHEHVYTINLGRFGVYCVVGEQGLRG